MMDDRRARSQEVEQPRVGGIALAEEREADGIVLPAREQRDGREDGAGVVEFREQARPAGVAQRGAQIEREADAELVFVLELFHLEPVRPAIEPPVNASQIVAGLVGAILGELRRGALDRAAVAAGEKTLDHVARAQRQRRQPRQQLDVDRRDRTREPVEIVRLAFPREVGRQAGWHGALLRRPVSFWRGWRPRSSRW